MLISPERDPAGVLLAGPRARRLPRPPDDPEAYLRKPRQWVVVVQVCAFVPILWSLGRFATSHPVLLLFFGWIALQVASMAIGLSTSLRRREVTLASHRNLLATAPQVLRRVDVFLPTCGEPLDVLLNTYQHVARLQHDSPVTVYVLDDAARSEVADAADMFGFRYLSRPNRGELKKAGNLRYGLERSDGDVILVLDADFVPRPDLLSHLLPYFADDAVGIVQSPQYFDTARSMSWLERSAGATQELFYRWIQPSRDTMSAAICVGTSAIYRRSALAAAGGFAQIAHSEDVHTGVALAAAGYRLRYVPVLVTKGLCPDDIRSFCSQQYRWATGSLSLLTDRGFHRHPEFSWRRRLPYFAGFLYYINASLGTVIAMLPGAVMFWAFPELVRPHNYLPFIGSLLVWFVLLPVVTHARWRVEVLRVQVIYSYAYLIAVTDRLRGRSAEWVPSGDSRQPNPISTRTLRVARIGVVANLGLTVSGLVHVTMLEGIGRVWPAYLLSALSTYVLGPVLWLPRVASWRQVLLSPFRLSRRDQERHRA